MAYAVTFTPAAAKSLAKLDRTLIAKIKTKVLALAENPRRQVRSNWPAHWAYTVFALECIDSFT